MEEDERMSEQKRRSRTGYNFINLYVHRLAFFEYPERSGCGRNEDILIFWTIQLYFSICSIREMIIKYFDREWRIWHLSYRITNPHILFFQSTRINMGWNCSIRRICDSKAGTWKVIRTHHWHRSKCRHYSISLIRKQMDSKK